MKAFVYQATSLPVIEPRLNSFDLIGNTPLVDVTNFSLLPQTFGVKVFAKLESFNFGGSVKDRPAYWMIKRAEERGVLKPGKVILEPTSGNTGIGLAWIGRLKGYEVVILLSESASMERIQTLRSFGATVILTPKEEGTDGAIRRARELVATNDNYVMLDQFSNEANIESHYNTTGPEIWEQTNHKVDHLVLGIGSGGTVMGLSRFFKEKNPWVKVIGVGPTDDAPIPGLKNMRTSEVPKIFSEDVLDQRIDVSFQEAVHYARKLASELALIVGPSSGAALCGVKKYLETNTDIQGNIITVFPDTGTRYFSLNIF